MSDSYQTIHQSSFGVVRHEILDADELLSCQYREGHMYSIYVGSAEGMEVELQFQNGPVNEVGVNGITNEQLLTILLHRMEILNKAFPCRENSLAITNMEQALMWLERRTRKRMAAGVEGTNQAIPGEKK